MHRGHAAQRRFPHRRSPRGRGVYLPAVGKRSAGMIEAVKFWNEPNNKSHWDYELDPEWSIFADLVKEASAAVRRVNPALPQVLGGISPIDPLFIERLAGRGVLDCVDTVAVHGFPL